LFEYSGEIGDVLWFIGFWNETNNRGKVTGFKYGAFVGDAPQWGEVPEPNKDGVISFTLEGQICYPFIPNATGNASDGYRYGDIHIELPANLKTNQCQLGGRLDVDYGIYAYGDRPFNRQDFLYINKQ
jgi:hypothetical protein